MERLIEPSPFLRYTDACQIPDFVLVKTKFLLNASFTFRVSHAAVPPLWSSVQFSWSSNTV